MPTPRARLATPFLAAAALACLAAAAPAQLEVVALSGDPTPEGTHVFHNFGLPVMGQDGSVTAAFITPDFITFGGVLQGQAGELATLVDENEPVPGGSPGDTFTVVPSQGPALNGQGTLALLATIGFNTNALLRQAGGGATQLLARGDDPAPDGNGTIWFNDWDAPTINAAGSVATRVSLFGTSGGTTDDQAILRFDAAGSPAVCIAREGDPAPGGGTLLGGFPDPGMNASGEVVFTSPTAFGEWGVFVGDGSTTTPIARTFDIAPGTGGLHALYELSYFNPINDAGEVAFAASFVGGGGWRALYLGDGSGTATLAMLGDPAPLAGGGFDSTYFALGTKLALNAGGQVAFLATTSQFAPFAGLFLTSAGGGDVCVARIGQLAPGGDEIVRVEEFALNDAGQVALRALMSPPAGVDYRAVFRWSPGAGLAEVIREGDPLAGSSVTSLELNGTLGTPSGARDRMGLNDAGEIAFRFALADNRVGLATTAPGAQPTWFDEGCALAGALGEPVLAGDGTLAAGSTNTIALTNAAPSAIAGLFLGVSSLPLPFKGGTLKPDPLLPPLIVGLPADGEVALPFVMPAGALPGTPLWFQWVIQDAGGPLGFALSNALRGVTP